MCVCVCVCVGDLGIVRPDTHGGREGDGEKEVERGEEATSLATIDKTLQV